MVHLVKVATEVLRVADGSFDVDFALQCALLHDSVEDAEVAVATLRSEFGARVADGVSALTKDDAVPKPERMPDSPAAHSQPAARGVDGEARRPHHQPRARSAARGPRRNAAPTWWRPR